MKKILFAAIFLLAAGCQGSTYVPPAKPGGTPTKPEPVYCTQEAKQCPDGVNYVGRTGPNCEFAPCPTATSTPK